MEKTSHGTLYFDRKLSNVKEACHSLSLRGAILADASLVKTHGAALQKALGYDLIPVPTGEVFKTRETKQKLEDELLKRKFGRDTVLVALGGGVTTDLVGFIASTYMRGVPLVLIPTTLLAMVDAAIGGKTGVDTPFGKNLIGSFYLPKAIFIDVDLLKTLPVKEWKNGLAEVLKYGLIDSPAIWNQCEKSWEKEVETIIQACIHCKMKIVKEDPQEKGYRRVLNFGHTVAHALELISDYKISHGEAVAIGCMAESYLSYITGFLPKETLDEILKTYHKLGYSIKKIDPASFLAAIKLDKKGKGGEPRFVLIDRIGRCVPFDGEYCASVKRDELDAMIEWMCHDVR